MEGVGIGDDDDDRKFYPHPPACPLEQGTPDRPEAPAEAEGCLDNSSTAANAAVGEWLVELDAREGQYLFPSRLRRKPHLSTRQYARIVHRWADRAGLDSSAYGTHYLRRTKPAQIYKKTGNLRAVQLLLGHTKLESTVRYLGIEVDDALCISEQVEL